LIGQKRRKREFGQTQRKCARTGTAKMLETHPAAVNIGDKAALFSDMDRRAATIATHLIFKRDYFWGLHGFTS